MKSPAKRNNDGHVMVARNAAPFSNTLRNMAALIPNERPVQDTKYKRGIGNCHAAKRALTEEQVREIRRRRLTGEWPSRIAPDFNVTVHTIKQLLQGRTYAWVL